MLNIPCKSTPLGIYILFMFADMKQDGLIIDSVYVPTRQ
jgi:hypothetical protein